MNFFGCNILISGIFSDLGFTLANYLKSMGANVIGIYHLTKKTCYFDTFKCDLTNEKDISKLFNIIKDKYNRIDALINVASYANDCDIYEKSAKEFTKTLNTNLLAPFLMCKYFTKIMDKGVIINVSSTDGIDTYSEISMDYCAAKAALNNLTKNLASRFPNLKICAIAPNWIDTSSTLSMNPNYLKEQMRKFNQKELLKKENVAMKIIEMIVNNDDYVTGEIIRMDDNNGF